MPPTFILASGSPRRRELLASLGIEFTVIKSDADESRQNHEDPVEYVRRLSQLKAATAAAIAEASNDYAPNTPLTILAADTSVILGDDILGKPADPDNARRMLLHLRNRPHTVCTGLTLMHLTRKTQHQVSDTWHDCTTVYMRDYSDEEIEAYIATGDPFDKAGGYAIQHEGFHPVERIDGSYSNVMGLPLETLQEMLKKLG